MCPARWRSGPAICAYGDTLELGGSSRQDSVVQAEEVGDPEKGEAIVGGLVKSRRSGVVFLRGCPARVGVQAVDLGALRQGRLDLGGGGVEPSEVALRAAKIGGRQSDAEIRARGLQAR